jgi:hypothetical protein
MTRRPGVPADHGAVAMNRQDREWTLARNTTFEAQLWVVLALVFVALLAGCATTLSRDSSEETKAAAAKARAQARWDLIVKGDVAGAYDFLSKSSKQVLSRAEFVSRISKTPFRTAVAEGVGCKQESCQVTVRYTYDHPTVKGVSNTVREDWILEEGNFWYVWSI